MTATRAAILVLSLACAFLLGREFARRPAGVTPSATYLDHVVQATQARLPASSPSSDQPIGFVRVADRLRPSVVSIQGTNASGGGSSGTGVVISEDGAILTNNHVIDGLGTIRVTLSSQDVYSATVVGVDLPTDLAVIRVEGLSGLLPVEFGDSDDLHVAEDVLAIGNAFGFGWTVTRGIVSSLHRSDIKVQEVDRRNVSARVPAHYTDYIQTDAAINPGNSGGPLVSARGQVIGINTAILSRSAEGIGFAIPANDAVFVAKDLLKRGYVRRGYLGMKGRDLAEFTGDERRRLAPGASSGFCITEVVPNTPAERAGLHVNDVVVAMEGRPVASFEILRNRVARIPPATDVSLRIVRGGQEREVRAVVGEFGGDNS